MLSARSVRSARPHRPCATRVQRQASRRSFASASPWSHVKEGALDENHATAHAFDAARSLLVKHTHC